MTKLNRVSRRYFRWLAWVTAATISVQELSASPITYTQTGHITGRIGGTALTDATVTLTTIGDTTNRQDLSSQYGLPVYYLAGSTTIAIDGIGTAAFSNDQFGMFTEDITSFGGPRYAGIGDLTIRHAILATSTSTFYDGVSNFTDSGTTIIVSNMTFQTTSLDDLVITNVSGNGTFTAVTSATVPEPSSFALMGLAVC